TVRVGGVARSCVPPRHVVAKGGAVGWRQGPRHLPLLQHRHRLSLLESMRNYGLLRTEHSVICACLRTVRGNLTATCLAEPRTRTRTDSPMLQLIPLPAEVLRWRNCTTAVSERLCQTSPRGNGCRRPCPADHGTEDCYCCNGSSGEA
ncbi:unnamed protein product, partial [Ascophyllum nodosum]